LTLLRLHNAIILAAGNSERIGFPKLSLAFDHQDFFFDRCVRMFLTLGCRKVIVVVNHEGQKWLAENNRLKQQDVSIVVNACPGSGRMFSLRLGLHASGLDVPAFVHNVDNPFVSLKTMSLLANEAATASGYAYVCPRHLGRGGHPILMSEWLVHEMVHAGKCDENLRVFLSRYKPLTVHVDDANVLVNINSMSDYKQAGLPLAP